MLVVIRKRIQIHCISPLCQCPSQFYPAHYLLLSPLYYYVDHHQPSTHLVNNRTIPVWNMIRRTEPNMSFGSSRNSKTIPSKQKREPEHSPPRLSPLDFASSVRNDDNKEEGPKATTLNQSSGSNSSTGTPKTVRTASCSSKRRSSTFYVPLTEDCQQSLQQQDSADEVYSLDLSACSFDWSLNDSVSSEGPVEEKPLQNGNSAGAIAKKTANDPLLQVTEGQSSSNNKGDDQQTSTPIKLLATNSRTRTNILNLADRISLSPLKEKSKTLPQNLNNSLREASFPAKSSLLLKSSPKISSTTMNDGAMVIVASASPPPQVIPLTAKSPRKSLSFIRRSHSTKVSRSSSLLRSFKQGEESAPLEPPAMTGLNAELLERLYKIRTPEDFDESLRRVFFKERRSEAATTDSSFSGQARGSGIGSGSRPEEEEGDRGEEGFHSGNNCRIGSLFFNGMDCGFFSLSSFIHSIPV